jgi:hypothetical protein
LLQALRDKNLDRWLPGYVRHLARRAVSPRYTGPRHVLFALCDHYEPLAGRVDDAHGTKRVQAWSEGYPILADRYRDSDGRTPRHSFFFPGEEYRPAHLDALAELARRGYGEVEVHLHHDKDTAASLEPQLVSAIENFAKHGHMSRGEDGRMRWAFIHGNWALANGHTDGTWCGVDDELPLLHRLGCYADFTFPSAPDESQPNRINQIYWPTGDLSSKRCYEAGTRARVGKVMTDRLLMIEGPLSIAHRPGKVPKIENGALLSGDPPSERRVRSWVSQNIHVEGRPEWVFVKVYTHGAPDKEGASLLGPGGDALHRALQRYNDGAKWFLHYVTAREMYNIAIAAMDGASGNPFAYRDHVIPPPPVASA